MATCSASLCDGWSVISDHLLGSSQKVAVFSLCCDKTHDQKQVGEGRVCLSVDIAAPHQRESVGSGAPCRD